MNLLLTGLQYRQAKLIPIKSQDPFRYCCKYQKEFCSKSKVSCYTSCCYWYCWDHLWIVLDGDYGNPLESKCLHFKRMEAIGERHHSN